MVFAYASHETDLFSVALRLSLGAIFVAKKWTPFKNRIFDLICSGQFSAVFTLFSKPTTHNLWSK